MGSLSLFDNPLKWTLFCPHDTCSTRLCMPKAVQSPPVPEQFREGLWTFQNSEKGLVLAMGEGGLFVLIWGLVFEGWGIVLLVLVWGFFSADILFFLFALSCYFPKPVSLFLIAQTPILQWGKDVQSFTGQRSGLAAWNSKVWLLIHAGNLLHSSRKPFPVPRMAKFSAKGFFFWLPVWV